MYVLGTKKNLPTMQVGKIFKMDFFFQFFNQDKRYHDKNKPFFLFFFYFVIFLFFDLKTNWALLA
jgi:hypothetical protein